MLLDAADIAKCVANRKGTLILNHLTVDDFHRLRNVADAGISFGCTHSM